MNVKNNNIYEFFGYHFYHHSVEDKTVNKPKFMEKYDLNIKMPRTITAAMMESWIRLEYGSIAKAIVSILFFVCVCFKQLHVSWHHIIIYFKLEQWKQEMKRKLRIEFRCMECKDFAEYFRDQMSGGFCYWIQLSTERKFKGQF